MSPVRVSLRELRRQARTVSPRSRAAPMRLPHQRYSSSRRRLAARTYRLCQQPRSSPSKTFPVQLDGEETLASNLRFLLRDGLQDDGRIRGHARQADSSRYHVWKGAECVGVAREPMMQMPHTIAVRGKGRKGKKAMWSGSCKIALPEARRDIFGIEVCLRRITRSIGMSGWGMCGRMCPQVQPMREQLTSSRVAAAPRSVTIHVPSARRKTIGNMARCISILAVPPRRNSYCMAMSEDDAGLLTRTYHVG